ncbi:hypothetical protein PHIM7_344 [Sinorhizobium phage phiM7]|uniref:Uncharacterized protein n=3 Tax=Emdodecavirus TaxID=1980937 RepID=S5MDK4_9CAUD|nr:hypothetical protein AB690_gp171 [Sinorhizobium phage phiM12]YP_009212589.1 hypothetical protein AVT40_gp184 [Sinorhizobium phage phiN3]YP_009601469.1 hypothetical protein FDH46_gp134 [Sinorhizobium phage phiM7]AKF13249.1 hypothetical protein PHIM19_344 [Sinorhizobium phage phiM19]AGR48074.2 hypothetical protein SmphiM12_442 [Sinorhizobium phage phiM12]AKF12889.1 hypothetical protein PHIM7_344 [Sinorhizobium phage phiM7]AKF13612.1 hypothetical protein PHIN3_349 [Sinorhizobium phage phiN3]
MNKRLEISVEFTDSIYFVPARYVQRWWKGEYTTTLEPAPIDGYMFLQEPNHDQWVAIRNSQENLE